MLIKGNKIQIKGAKVSSHDDNRIAMACAVAALGAKGNTTIHEAERQLKWEHGRASLKILKVKAAVQIS